ncbi:Zn-dependent hydrolase, glyoxylase [Halobacteroides halobius DSM 5150]|uniref:Zn-dependent hydrolase, glyoxylase n=1 Tax=Halobacteroides halobius (strain ATCC 35273 / DSM 5150 / MD-1) TaxID=748449 RepID=L0KCG1_HALHC|nr:MBL fold metallo-hydrolase [Halobacteroides halobius]AGB41758.1 Zn-dependent hydrolase, glyoxylase [Halobacteroides halobius DSM 5150]
MLIKRIVVGNLKVNCYLVIDEDTKKAIIIDPGANKEAILEKVNEQNLTVKYIINTHVHADHIGANKYLLEETGAKLLVHKADAEFLQDPKLNLSAYIDDPQEKIISPVADKLLVAGDKIECGNLTFEVVHTPGHTPGSICLKSKQILFSGDTLFARGVGRTDFPQGSSPDLKNSLQKITQFDLNLKLYPGHGPTTTLEKAKKNNPYI